MGMALPEGLLEAVRNYLDITWADADLDKKLTGIIERGIKYIDSVAGAAMDYEVEDKPRGLLLDYCRYVRSNALNEFQINYQHELLSLQMAQDITVYKDLVKLSALSVGVLGLTPAFAPEVKLNTAKTSNSEDVITATADNPLAVVNIINGSTAIENGKAAVWADGKNIVTITVTNGSAVTTYTVVITKE
jgi:hypothetical protein